MAETSVVMVPSLKMGGLVPVDWKKVKRRLQKSQWQIERAQARARLIEKILYKSFTATAWLWVQQGGKCPCCGKPITWMTGLNKHHIIPKSQGGSDALKNLQLVHPDCHALLHSERANDIREAQNLLFALNSCLQRLGPISPDDLEALQLISPWLESQAALLACLRYPEAESLVAA